MRISDWSSDVCSSDLALDDAVDDLGGPVLVLLELALPLELADLLDDHLLGGLGGDAAEVDRRQRLLDHAADLPRRVAAMRLGQGDLPELVLPLPTNGGSRSAERRVGK